MRRCTYYGKKYDDSATACAIDQQPVVEVPAMPKDPSVAFLRLLFKSHKEEDFAIRCAQFLARIVGERITLLRPDTKWSEIIEWSGPSSAHGALLAIALHKEFGVAANEILANPEFTTFRDFVEYVCDREDKAA